MRVLSHACSQVHARAAVHIPLDERVLLSLFHMINVSFTPPVPSQQGTEHYYHHHRLPYRPSGQVPGSTSLSSCPKPLHVRARYHGCAGTSSLRLSAIALVYHQIQHHHHHRRNSAHHQTPPPPTAFSSRRPLPGTQVPCDHDLPICHLPSASLLHCLPDDASDMDIHVHMHNPSAYTLVSTSTHVRSCSTPHIQTRPRIIDLSST